MNDRDTKNSSDQSNNFNLIKIINSKEVRSRLKVIFILSLDTGLFIIWVLLQWSIDEFLLKKFPLPLIDTWTEIVIQIVFAISTSAAIGTYTWKDIISIIIEAKIDVEEKEKELKSERLRKIMIENTSDINKSSINKEG
jgi:hypothetical protein